jgi:hypothetical protein
MTKKKEQKGKVVDMKGVEKEVTKKAEVKVLQIPADEAQNYLSIIGLMLVGDDRLKPLSQHFIDMIKRNNEGINEQPTQ